MTDRSLPPGLHRDTLAVRAALERSQYGENSEALFLTSSFVQPDADTSARRFAGTEEGFTYARTSNPTVTSFEQRLAALEGTEAAIGASSGMGAILMMCMGLLKAGDHVVVLALGVRLHAQPVRHASSASSASRPPSSRRPTSREWRAAMRPDTRLLFAETPTNPLTDVCDIRALADLAHGAGALLAVDNCFCSPALQQPVEARRRPGHALGHQVPGRAGPRDGRRDLRHREASITEMFGPSCAPPAWCSSPFNAWVVLKGMETLGIRMQAQCASALARGAVAGSAAAASRACTTRACLASAA